MKFEYLKNLRGDNGERFADEPLDYRDPVVGEWYCDLGGHPVMCDLNRSGCPRLILTRAKTAREWLSELPDGWREEALAGLSSGDVCVSSLIAAVSLLVFCYLPSGSAAWIELLTAVQNGTPIPPHPSRAKPKPKPKVERLEVVGDRHPSWLWAGEWSLDCWPGRADFLGFVYVLPNGEEAFGVAATLIWWSDEAQDWKLRTRGSWTTPLRPKFVELAK